MVRAEIIFHGRVQGVGFRATARHIASSFSVSGWVRNEPDRTVRLVAEGDTREVGAFIEAIRVRMGDRITSISRQDSSPQGEVGFAIRS